VHSSFGRLPTTLSDLDAQRPALVAVAFTPAPFEIPVDTWLRGKWLLVRRTSARLRQGAIVTISAVCPRERWDELKYALWLAHLSTELLGTTPEDASSEQRSRVSSLASSGCAGRGKGPAFETVAPASWAAEPAQSTDKDISGVHVRLIGSGDTVLAYIAVRALRHASGAKPAQPDLIAQAKRMAAGSGIQLSSEPEPISAADDPRSEAVQGWLGGVPRGRPSQWHEPRRQTGFRAEANADLHAAHAEPEATG